MVEPISELPTFEVDTSGMAPGIYQFLMWASSEGEVYQQTLAQAAVLVEPPPCTSVSLSASPQPGLVSAPVVRAVAGRLRAARVTKLVVDPVMRAKDGSPLLEPRAAAALTKELLPLALVVTPNAPEAERLTGLKVGNASGARRAARAIRALGPAFVLVKGGHLDGPVCEDLLFDGSSFSALRSPRADTGHTHGTGCTLSAAIAAGLALGLDVPAAVRRAKRYVTGAIRNAPCLGKGAGPLEHFWEGR
jgi:hydroxymethylpyrimidine/phosphomethylpyrimidine kinase